MIFGVVTSRNVTQGGENVEDHQWNSSERRSSIPEKKKEIIPTTTKQLDYATDQNLASPFIIHEIMNTLAISVQFFCATGSGKRRRCMRRAMQSMRLISQLCRWLDPVQFIDRGHLKLFSGRRAGRPHSSLSHDRYIFAGYCSCLLISYQVAYIAPWYMYSVQLYMLSARRVSQSL